MKNSNNPTMGHLHFIVGCPRSGTYLLSNILDQSAQIAIPTETHFIPLFSRYAFLFGNLRNQQARVHLLNAIYAFLEIWLIRAEAERDFHEMVQHSLLVTRSSFDDIIEESTSYAEMVHAIYMRYAALKGVILYGDKSAFFQHISLEKIDHAVGNQAKIIHIVRDGRDVCLSWMKLSMGPENLPIAAYAWRKHINEKRRWGARHPDRYCEIRYEDLLEMPEREIRKICAFIGIAFHSQMLQFHHGEMARAISNSSTHALLNQPIDPTNREKWRSNMSAEDIAFFEWIAHKELAASGYPLMKSKITFTKRFSFFLRSISTQLQSQLSYRTLRLTLKGFLPAILLISVFFNLRIEKIVNSKKWLHLEGMPLKRK